LKRRDEIGTEEYQKEQGEKADILKWLLDNYNDGRKKSFFCLAVNLLELEDLKTIKRQVSLEDEVDGLPIKERAACVKRMLEDKARERQIELKLRKKK
jgi:hypothetical protein